MSDENTHDLSVITEVDLIYRNKQKVSERPKIKSSLEAYDILRKTWDENKIELLEQFKIVLLDRNGSCIGLATVASGGMSSCAVDLKIAFATALKARATSIILAHNHPSGNLQQSAADEKLTTQFENAGKILDLPVLDHLIITKDGYTSLADIGLMNR
jgi:DNA repair protein RadC